MEHFTFLHIPLNFYVHLLMRTNTIFYQLFLTFHSLLFQLLGQPLEKAEHYKFTSVEVKKKAFRFDENNIYLNQYQPL